LASCWLSFLFRTQWAQRQANNARDGNDDHGSLVQLLQDNCPILSSDQAGLRSTRKWQRQDCDRFCQIVLREKFSSYCLCCCPFHRDELVSVAAVLKVVSTDDYYHVFILSGERHG
jgi:hypothetical protein